MVLIFLYHSAAEDGVPVIEHGGLTGGYRALRLVKDDVNAVAPDRRHRRPLLGVAVAYLRLAAQLMHGCCAAYPVEVCNIRFAAEQTFITAEHDLVRVRADIADVQRRGRGDAEPLALADGVEVGAVVRADLFAVADRVVPRFGQRREFGGGKRPGRGGSDPSGLLRLSGPAAMYAGSRRRRKCASDPVCGS